MPEVSTYMYDEQTGYYYDASTGLYYDANSQYYYNSMTQKYLYWDATQMTYLLAPTLQTSMSHIPTTATATVTAPPVAPEPPTVTIDETKEKKKIKVEKPDKVKVAKKIAKDMERWAKTMSRSKDVVGRVAPGEQASSSSATAASADIGFAVLEKKAAVGSNSPNLGSKIDKSNPNSALVAAYGSDTSGDEENGAGALIEGLDWENLVCLLCKRKFSSKEGLAKHQKVSDLHRTNLEQYCQQHGIDKDQGNFPYSE